MPNILLILVLRYSGYKIFQLYSAFEKPNLTEKIAFELKKI